MYCGTEPGNGCALALRPYGSQYQTFDPPAFVMMFWLTYISRFSPLNGLAGLSHVTAGLFFSD